ncbi:MAG: hypothetical protein QGF00_00435 [Planctomycetota bacterium]|nr:hypothetical protein [Planctomycetota bacterium]
MSADVVGRRFVAESVVVVSDAGCWILDAGCAGFVVMPVCVAESIVAVSDAGYWMLDVPV